MCLAENLYYPDCGCWGGHEVISPCIRRPGGAGGECRELVVQGVLRKSGPCLPCQRKKRPQLTLIGRNLSSFMNEINENVRRRETEDLASVSDDASTARSIETPEPGLQGERGQDAVRMLQSLEDDDTLVGDDDDDDDRSDVQQEDDSSQPSHLDRYRDLHRPAYSRSWYYVADSPASPSGSEAGEWELGRYLLGGPAAVEGEEQLVRQGASGSATRPPAPEAKGPKNRCCTSCVPS